MVAGGGAARGGGGGGGPGAALVATAAAATLLAARSARGGAHHGLDAGPAGVPPPPARGRAVRRRGGAGLRPEPVGRGEGGVESRGERGRAQLQPFAAGQSGRGRVGRRHARRAPTARAAARPPRRFKQRHVHAAAGEPRGGRRGAVPGGAGRGKGRGVGCRATVWGARDIQRLALPFRPAPGKQPSLCTPRGPGPGRAPDIQRRPPRRRAAQRQQRGRRHGGLRRGGAGGGAPARQVRGAEGAQGEGSHPARLCIQACRPSCATVGPRAPPLPGPGGCSRTGPGAPVHWARLHWARCRAAHGP
jgi:hypothetical protein